SSWPARAVVGALVGAFLLTAIPAAFHWIDAQSKEPPGGGNPQTLNNPQLKGNGPTGTTIHIYNAPVTQIIETHPVQIAQSDDKRSPPTINIQNAPGSIIGPSGGQNTITNNFGPQPRNLDSPWGAPLKAQILKDLPRDKEITVMAVLGDVEGIQLAHQIHTF